MGLEDSRCMFFPCHTSAHNSDKSLLKFLRLAVAKPQTLSPESYFPSNNDLIVLNCKIFIPKIIPNSLTSDPDYESINASKRKMEAWLMTTGARILSAETNIISIPFSSSSIATSVDSCLKSISENVLGHYLVIYRIYIDGHYLEPPSRLLPISLNADNENNKSDCNLIFESKSFQRKVFEVISIEFFNYQMMDVFDNLLLQVIMNLLSLSQGLVTDEQWVTESRRTRLTKPTEMGSEENTETNITLILVIVVLILVSIIAISVAVLIYYRIKSETNSLTRATREKLKGIDTKSKQSDKTDENATRVSSIETIDSNTGFVVTEKAIKNKK